MATSPKSKQKAHAEPKAHAAKPTSAAANPTAPEKSEAKSSTQSKVRQHPTSRPKSLREVPFDSLRPFYHSIHDSERSEAIELLASSTDPAAARELIQFYQDCQWRETRLRIIRALAKHPSPRSFEFLFKLCQEPKDLPIAEAAISALGQTHHPRAARFLVLFYEKCSEFIKPSVIGALGRIPDRTLAQEFLRVLPEAVKTQQLTLAKHLILTLGELKVHEALPELQRLASDGGPALALSALVAIGKISRDPVSVGRLEQTFEQDPFEYQLFASVRTQVQFRSRWRLEDYLSKIFESDEGEHATTLHPSLPYELSHFDSKDVLEGLKMFYLAPEHFERLCTVLARVESPDVAGWYSELLRIPALIAAPTTDTDNVTKMILVLRSLGSRWDLNLAPLLRSIGESKLLDEPACLLAWIEATTLCLPDADSELKAFFCSERYRKLTESQRIVTLNHIIDAGLCAQTHPSRLQSVGRTLETILESDPSIEVQARCIRGLGHLGFVSRKALQYIKERLAEPILTGSCLKYLELCPERSALSSLTELMKTPTELPTASLLRTLAQLPQLDEKSDAILEFVTQALGSSADPDIRVEALRLLSRHPKPSLLPAVLGCLALAPTIRKSKGGTPETKVALAALIAIKAHASQCDDSVAERIAPLLRSAHPSLAGRALDTLTSLPGLRAKRFVIDLLKERAKDMDVCDKIVRCLEPPQGGAEYFVDVVDEILRANPGHPHEDGLLALRERLAAGKTSELAGTRRIKAADVIAMDRSLEKRVPEYESLEENAKSALRSAEMPFLHPEMYDESIDKSSSLVEYCKAIDIVLERHLGHRLLFPKLENHLHEFQNSLHASGLGEEHPTADRVMQQMGLERHFSPQSFPLHKMTTLAQSIRTGRIVHERFKTFDGLRAWAVVLLVFGRGIQGQKALIPVRHASEEQLITCCKRLIALQEIRNPAAHRQTVLKIASLDETRAEALSLLGSLQKMF